LLRGLGNATSTSNQQQGKLFMETHMHIKLTEVLTRPVGGRSSKNYRNVQAGQTSHILIHEQTKYKHNVIWFQGHAVN